MLSNSSKYAIKGVLFLAVHSKEDKKVLVRDIYKTIDVPEAYLAKLLQELARHGIISSTRGPKGGFFLSEADRSRTLMDIVKVIDGEKKIHSCVLGVQECNMENPCALHHIIGPSKSGFIEVFEETTIEKLMDQSDGIEAIFSKAE